MVVFIKKKWQGIKYTIPVKSNTRVSEMPPPLSKTTPVIVASNVT